MDLGSVAIVKRQLSSNNQSVKDVSRLKLGCDIVVNEVHRVKVVRGGYRKCGWKTTPGETGAILAVVGAEKVVYYKWQDEAWSEWNFTIGKLFAV